MKFLLGAKASRRLAPDDGPRLLGDVFPALRLAATGTVPVTLHGMRPGLARRLMSIALLAEGGRGEQPCLWREPQYAIAKARGDCKEEFDPDRAVSAVCRYNVGLVE
ncbi:hypothetical protein [Chromobacterium phragmitis]|uniref:Uncharacterized protein n=1 Tax=Chromobacterium phragmitis TaxID=2202141 RepID=A0A344UCN2_9NEIS|nr:hypothetical protein DK843_01075 [Chromobacterium phragmitis]